MSSKLSTTQFSVQGLGQFSDSMLSRLHTGNLNLNLHAQDSSQEEIIGIAYPGLGP